MVDLNLDKIPLEQIGPLAKLGIGLLKKILASAWKRYGKRKSEKLLSTIIMELLKVHPDIDAAKAKLIAIKATNSEPNLHLLQAESLLKKVEEYHIRPKTVTGMNITSGIPMMRFSRVTVKRKISRKPRRVKKVVKRYQRKSLKTTLDSASKKQKRRKRKYDNFGVDPLPLPRGCQEGMRTEISSGEEALKGPLKILSTCLDFVGLRTFPANPILPTA